MVKFKPGKITEMKIMPNKTCNFFYPDEKTFYYTKLTDFKMICFTCSPNGFWKIDLLKLCHPSCRNLDDLRKRQANAEIAKSCDNVILTLAGLFILQKFYALKKNSWLLVEAKAFNALVKELAASGIAKSKNGVQKLVEDFKIEFSTDQSDYAYPATL